MNACSSFVMKEEKRLSCFRSRHGWLRMASIGCLLANSTFSGCHSARNRLPVSPAPAGNSPEGIASASGSTPHYISPLAYWKPTHEFLIHAPRSLAKVALTFDAGHDDRAVQRILAVLTERKVRCTFFLTGQFCEKFPRSSRAIAEAGMELGNHSYSHPKFSRLSPEEVASQLERGEAAIEAACGHGAKPLFRFPYGDSNRRSLAAVTAGGYQAIHWSLDSLDAFGKPKSANFVAERCLKRLKPGDIVLMHVSCPGSAEALPRIFDYLDRMGIEVVPISELLLAQRQTALRTEPSRFRALRKL